MLNFGVHPNTMFIVYRRNVATSLFDNEVIPFTLYVFVNNAYSKTAQAILDYIVDKYSGNIQFSYVTYVDSITGQPVTVTKDKVPSGITGEKLYSWVNETFDKATIFNDMIPAGTQYFVSFTMSTTFVVAKNVAALDLQNVEYWDNGENSSDSQKIKLPLIQATISFNVEHDSQPFYGDPDTNIPYQFPISTAKFGTLVLSLVLPMKNNLFTKKVLDIVNFKYRDPNLSDTNREQVATINSEFYIKYSYINGEQVYYNKFKFQSFNYIKTLGEGDSYVIQLMT